MDTVRVYRDDNSLYEFDYVAVVNGQCYLAELLTVEIPEWKHASIRLMERIECPHPGLLDGTVRAIEGWHYLLDSEDIDKLHDTTKDHADVRLFVAAYDKKTGRSLTGTVAFGWKEATKKAKELFNDVIHDGAFAGMQIGTRIQYDKPDENRQAFHGI